MNHGCNANILTLPENIQRNAQIKMMNKKRKVPVVKLLKN